MANQLGFVIFFAGMVEIQSAPMIQRFLQLKR
jgi:hypothetical protein